MEGNYLTVLFFSGLLGFATLMPLGQGKANVEKPEVVQNTNTGNHNSWQNSQPDQTPVSVHELSSWMLLGLGLAGIAFVKKIRSKS